MKVSMIKLFLQNIPYRLTTTLLRKHIRQSTEAGNTLKLNEA